MDEPDVARTVAEFTGLWAALLPRERRRVVETIVERVAIDGGQRNFVIGFRSTRLPVSGETDISRR